MNTKNKLVIGLIFLLLVMGNFKSEAKDDCDKILFNIHDNDINMYGDTIYFEKLANVKLFFLNGDIYFNRKKICCFSNILCFHEFVYLERNHNKYLYIYPSYEQNGVAIIDAQGVLIEINENRNTIIKHNYPYFSPPDPALFRCKEYKVRKNSNKCFDR